MEINVGKMAGFCPGIINAVTKTDRVLDESNNEKVYCLGELTHNRQVIERLENKGLVIIDDIDECTDQQKLIIRSHGVCKEIYEKAEQRKIDLIDLTCPKVLKIHKVAEEHAKNEYYIFLVAEKNHPEVIGTYSFCGENKCIIQNKDEIDEAIEKLKNTNIKKVYVVTQTTFSMEKFDDLMEQLKEKMPKDVELEINKSICDATRLRQAETKEISQNVEYMIIIGGKNSSNTKKLFYIAQENCNNAVWIQTKEDLDIEDIKQYKNIGIMAGASTPKESIDGVIECLQSLE